MEFMFFVCLDSRFCGNDNIKHKDDFEKDTLRFYCGEVYPMLISPTKVSRSVG